MARYLVTGGAGFIGSNLARYILLQDARCTVTVLDNFATGKRENLAGVVGSVRLVEGDIRCEADVRDAMSGCVAVFHQAALGSVPRSIDDPRTSHDVNVNGTMIVLEVARSLGVKRVVFAASSSAYGEQAVSPKHEGMPPTPISPYAATKVAGEAAMIAYAAAFGMETVSLRYFNVFGPRQDPFGAYAAVMPAFVSRLLRGESPVVFGDGEQSRDFCYIDNVCHANWLAVQAPAARCNGEPLNIACQQAVTLNQILAQLSKLLDVEIPAIYYPKRPGDVRHSLANITKARDTIGYSPSILFDEGLRRSIAWYRENLAAPK